MLAHCLQGFAQKKVLFVTPLEPDVNFSRAISALDYRWMISPQDLNVKDMLNADYVVITKKALEELELILESREKNLFRNRKLPREELPYDSMGLHKSKKLDHWEQVKNEMKDVKVPKNFVVMNMTLRNYLKEYKQQK